MSLPDPETLAELKKDEVSDVLGHLFEPCPVLCDFIIKEVIKEPFNSYTTLIESTRGELLSFLEREEAKSSVSPDVASIISAHPRLGPSKDKLSSHSNSEQKSLAGGEEEANKLADLNAQYEATFPGLRYVVFVNGRSRETIMQNMTERIQRNDIAAERREAFNAMCDIALDRARKLGAKL
ncbi:hypothetical protein FT663_00920 [Candidozyma haemuli var. vulneris]|uniref:Oxo-4-hydroxy-4-carboxy-5-ureidoimidazoline decarboxylase domain-containing protein n=1 Tax=Candidozyma haemuli TaxID=45357 RepID=A0A2V1AQT5_9ASCO|nr:hypothetical protein CXQ85_001882 [[Candida] haemuloni]KAF3993096.1 hypothetical protein FT662_00724 [[Candida] haemuloni var. vulneris]KAF3994946.1 hypothetical protein FT663_00920 [[Candida] haemuloni var. vulneris]PVH20102.1 hypothetical protein CXQ85_001882 [[Candida] haemuloni]